MLQWIPAILGAVGLAGIVWACQATARDQIEWLNENIEYHLYWHESLRGTQHGRD